MWLTSYAVCYRRQDCGTGEAFDKDCCLFLHVLRQKRLSCWQYDSYSPTEATGFANLGRLVGR